MLDKIKIQIINLQIEVSREEIKILKEITDNKRDKDIYNFNKEQMEELDFIYEKLEECLKYFKTL